MKNVATKSVNTTAAQMTEDIRLVRDAIDRMHDAALTLSVPGASEEERAEQLAAFEREMCTALRELSLHAHNVETVLR